MTRNEGNFVFKSMYSSTSVSQLGEFRNKLMYSRKGVNQISIPSWKVFRNKVKVNASPVKAYKPRLECYSDVNSLRTNSPKGSRPSDSKKTSEKTSGRPSNRTSRSSIPRLDTELLKSSLEKVKESRDMPRANIRVRRSSTASSIGQFLSPGTALSYRSSLSKLDLNLEGNAILPSPVYLDSYRASNRSSAGFLFESAYQAAGGFSGLTPRSAWNYLDGTSAFSRRESRNNTGDSDEGSNLLQCSNRTSVVKGFDGLAGELRPDCEQAGLVLNFPEQLPEYTPRNSFQFNKTPRHK